MFSSDPFGAPAFPTSGPSSYAELSAEKSSSDAFGFETTENFGAASSEPSIRIAQNGTQLEANASTSNQDVYDELTEYAAVSSESTTVTDGPKSLDWFLVGSPKEKANSSMNTFGTSEHNLNMVSSVYVDMQNNHKT